MRKRKITIDTDNYFTFVKNGGLKSIREIRREIQKIEFVEHKIGFNSSPEFNLKVYDTQSNIIRLFSSKSILKMIQAHDSKKILRLACPPQWLTIFSKYGQFVALNQSIFNRFLLSTTNALFSLAKCLNFLIKILKINSVNTTEIPVDVFLVGHSKKIIFQRIVDGEYSLINWLNNNEIRCHGLYMCGELEYFLYKWQFITADNKRREKALKLIRKFIVDFKSFKSPLSLKLRHIDQLLYLSLTSTFPEFFTTDRIFFSESKIGSRPIWSYKSEHFKCVVTYMEFSHSAEPNTVECHDSTSDRFDLFTYDHVIVASKFIERRIRNNVNKLVKKPSISVLGVPWLLDCSKHRPTFDLPYIAVFDYVSTREHFGISTLNDLGYSSRSLIQEFLSPILKECQELGVNVYRKPKRWMDGKSLYPESSKFLEEISGRPNYHKVCPEVAATRVIKGAIGVISMAPTTTAFIAKTLGIPSVFFDPFNQLVENDAALEGIEVLSSQEDIRRWLYGLLKGS